MSVLTHSTKTKTVRVTQPEQIKKSGSTKTRGFMSGQRMTPLEMETEIIRLSQTHKIIEIVNITGKNRRTIERYIKTAKDSGKILTNESGRITLPADELAKRQYQKITRDELYEKFQPVRAWVDARRAEAKGEQTKLKRIRDQLGKLKVVCDTTKLNPYVILASDGNKSYAGLERTMYAFSIAMTEKRVVYQTKQQQLTTSIDSSFREFLMAIRNFAAYNGVAIPKMPQDNILSGKKVSFGLYAHIKMSEKEIDQCVTLLTSQHGENSIEVAMFVFYYLTGCRNNSIYNAKTSTCKVERNGWITCRVFESKTKISWTKYLPNDNVHFQIIETWITLRKNQNKMYLFSENGNQTQTFRNQIVANFKKVYEQIDFAENYFIEHAVHCLRHVATHYWLDKTKLNPAAVAKIVGWKDIQTLITCYGAITDEQIFDIATGTIK